MRICKIYLNMYVDLIIHTHTPTKNGGTGTFTNSQRSHVGTHCDGAHSTKELRKTGHYDKIGQAAQFLRNENEDMEKNTVP